MLSTEAQNRVFVCRGVINGSPGDRLTGIVSLDNPGLQRAGWPYDGAYGHSFADGIYLPDVTTQLTRRIADLPAEGMR